jgi:type I restriction enzyme R subunit
MQSNIDDYIYSPEDEIISGMVQQGKVYTEEDFYKGNIKIRQRDEARVREFLAGIGETEKTLVFCATQAHAAEVRDMINAERKKKGYCQRVTANDGATGEEYLSDFQDNEKTIPTVLTTSEKLSTGVDARNVRHIVLMRPVNSMIEFKQIIGRGTRIYDGKYYFTIWDFVHAYEKYSQPDWDGEPVCPKCGNNPCTCVVKPRGHREEGQPSWVAHEDIPEPTPDDPNDKLEIVLPDHRVRRIKFINSIMFWGADGKPVSAQKFIEEMFGRLPDFFKSSEDLHKIWADPETREALLDRMNEAGYGKDILRDIRRIIDAEGCDLLDVLEYIAYATTPIERKERAQRLTDYTNNLGDAQKQFIEYMIHAYVQSGIDELRMDKLKTLLELKFGSVGEGITALGGVPNARQTFKDFQYHLYA